MAGMFKAAPRSVLLSVVGDMDGWRQMGNRMLSGAQQLCPVGEEGDDYEGPHLVDTLEARFITGSDPRVLLGSASKGDVLGYLVKGTDAHPIDAVNAQALHFIVDGADVFTKNVDHPGTEANDFLTEAIRGVAQDGG